MDARHLDLKVGDEVDFHQHQSNKDTPGWFGPADVVDLSRLDHGQISVRYNNKVREVMTQNVRRHLFFLVFLAQRVATDIPSVWRTIRQAIEHLDSNLLMFVGYVRQLKGMHWSQNNAKLPGIFEAIKFLSENHLNILFVMAARLGIGISGTKSLAGYSSSTTLLWKPQWQYVQVIEQAQDANGRSGQVNLRRLYPDDWSELRMLQLFTSADAEEEQEAQEPEDANRRSPNPPPSSGQQSLDGDLHPPRGPLSTIDEADEAHEGLDSFLLNEDPDLQRVLSDTKENLSSVLEDCGESLSAEPAVEPELDDRLPLNLMAYASQLCTEAFAADVEIRDLYPDEEVLFEFAVYPPMTNTVPDAPPVGEDEMLVFKTSPKTGTRMQVTT